MGFPLYALRRGAVTLSIMNVNYTSILTLCDPIGFRCPEEPQPFRQPSGPFAAAEKKSVNHFHHRMAYEEVNLLNPWR
jgi:hypothetical protein